MSHEELFYLLALQNTTGIGDLLAKKLVSHFGTAHAVFQAKPKELIRLARVSQQVVCSLQKKHHFQQAERELQRIMADEVSVIAFNEPNYPIALQHCPDGPLLLYVSGRLPAINKPWVSIVGTRDVTPQGARFIKELVSELALFEPVIVSGFAYGVDILAHQAALENSLQTVAVLGSGLRRIYPAVHKQFVPKIKTNGAIVTEFWSEAAPERENFVRRNRIVAGLSMATIVVESPARGGSLITANYAVDYNREVFAVPGRPDDQFSIGCNNLIKTQRAHVLTSAADLVYIMNWKPSVVSGPATQKKLFVSLEPDELTIYEYLRQHGKQLLDQLALQCKQPVFTLSAVLLNMELKGVVRPLPGKMFEAI